MNTFWNAVLALVACGLFVSTVSAQQNNPNRNTQKQNAQDAKQALSEAQKNDVDHFLHRFDRNNDNAIQKDELPNRLQDGFDDVDKNSDGKLDSQELQQHALRMNSTCDQCQTGYILIYRAEVDPVSLKDLQNSYEILRKMDKDNDGKITQQEVKSGMATVRKHHAQGILREWDRDNDQKLSQKEAGGFLGNQFEQIDRNRDNFIDAHELEQAFVPQQTENTSLEK